MLAQMVNLWSDKKTNVEDMHPLELAKPKPGLPIDLIMSHFDSRGVY